jgi:hypothetical protein
LTDMMVTFPDVCSSEAERSYVGLACSSKGTFRVRPRRWSKCGPHAAAVDSRSGGPG